MNVVFQIFIFLIISFFGVQKVYADVCTPVSKPTKYIARNGEQIAEMLRVFNLEPVYGVGASLDRLLKANNLASVESIEPGTELILPFTCEEQTNSWRKLDRGEDRIITLEATKLKTGSDTIVIPNVEVKNRTLEIIDADMQAAEKSDAEIGASEEMSEALRYRMICDGEWTGTECITRYSALYVLGGAWYLRHDSIDATTKETGTLLSKLNPEIGFGWHNYWYENFRTNLGISIINNEIHPEVRERPIEQSKKTIASIFADAKYETGPFGFSFGVTQTEKLFYRFSQNNIFLFESGGVVVNAVPILIIRGALSYMFLQTGKFRFDAEVGLISLQGAMTSGYDVDPGSGWDLAVSVQHDRVKEYLFGTIKYEKSQQDTQILYQNAQELGIKVGYAWKLKDW